MSTSLSVGTLSEGSAREHRSDPTGLRPGPVPGRCTQSRQPAGGRRFAAADPERLSWGACPFIT